MVNNNENKEQRPIDRLHDFAEWCKEERLVPSIYAFEKECGLSIKYLTNAAQLKGNVSSDIILRIYRRFPQLNVAWVVTGEGQMTGTANETPYKAAYKAKCEECEALIKIIENLENST